MRIFRRVVALAVFVILLVAGWLFANNNGDPVRVDYLFGDFVDIAMWQVLIVSFALGSLITAVLLGLQLAAARLSTRRMRKKLNDLESEVHQLRNLPLSEPELRASPQQTLAAPGGAATVNN